MNTSPSIVVSLLISYSAFALLMGLLSRTSRQQVALPQAPTQRNAPATLRDLTLAQPRSERILKPLFRLFHGLGRLLTPSRNIELFQNDLLKAGLLEQLTVIDFLGMRILSGFGLGTFLFMLFVLLYPLASALLVTLAGTMIGLYLPNIWLRNRITARQQAITRSLPDALDRISICVDAGLGFEAALHKVSLQGKNELAEELRGVINEIRLGVPRAEALRHLVERTAVDDIASFVAVLIQADQLGIAIRTVLHTQSEQMRVRRRQRAEESAHKAPIKMLFPLVFFIFPAMFAVILGPAIPRILAVF